MAQKNQLTASDYLSIEEFSRLTECLRKDKLYIWELYARLGVYTTLRCSDILSLKWEDILNKSSFIKNEKKTDKRREIFIDKNKMKIIAELYSLLGAPSVSSYVFAQKTDTPITSQYINRKLKTFRVKYQLKIQNFSTHTFRKTFSRYFYDMSENKSEALVILCEILNHSSIQNTKIYLNLQKEDVQKAYTAFPV